MRKWIILILFCFPAIAFSDDCCELIRDLMMIDCINQKLDYRFPVYYNNTLQGGYINMPSARMGRPGEISFGFSYVSPYRNYNGRVQLFDGMEMTGSYRIFSEIIDPAFGTQGFGEFSDKGVNIKLALTHAEDFQYSLPSIAFGWDDFLGTKMFESQYVVATQVFPQYDFEASIGYGRQRIKGLFGGFFWLPFRKSSCWWLQGLGFSAEYDRTDYKNDPHPKGRCYRTRLNVGAKWRVFDYFDFSASYVRGEKWALSAAAQYNFGETCGFITKISDPLPYTSTVNNEPAQGSRSDQILIAEFSTALKCQGFDLLKVSKGYSRCFRKALFLNVFNCKWRTLYQMRTRLNSVLAALHPTDVDEVIVIIESEGFPVQQFVYHTPFLSEFAENAIGDCELNLLTPMTEARRPDPCTTTCLYSKSRKRFCWRLRPDFQFYFGSAKGKFKYAISAAAEFEGFLACNVFYDVCVLYPIRTTLNDVGSVDILNPSQIINVRTDLVRYLKKTAFRVERAYLQKSWNMGCGVYSRVASGLFEQMYGGSALEFLWYPVNRPFAIGLEGALLRKRTLTGVGFSDKVRKLQGFDQTFQKFQGVQYFLDLYYDFQDFRTDWKISIGQFMAKDKGARIELGKYFPSGLRVYLWYTRTTANDRINGERYYDKGIGFSMPLDVFYTCTSKERWGHEMSAWLRDTGYRASTGRRLYETIRQERWQ